MPLKPIRGEVAGCTIYLGFYRPKSGSFIPVSCIKCGKKVEANNSVVGVEGYIVHAKCSGHWSREES